MKIATRYKKLFSLIAIGSGVSFFWTPSAQSADDYLQQIAMNTKGTLEQVNQLPTYFDKIVKAAISWLATDDQTESTAQMGVGFNSLGTQAANNFTAQNNLQIPLAAAILGVPASDLTAAQGKTAKINDTLPQVNNIMYSSIIGKVPAPSLAFSPTDYIKNAGGATLVHPIPQKNWQGKLPLKDAYESYFNVMMSVESFSAYVLSNLVAENQSGNQVTVLQNDLINKATDAGWLVSITTEELGKVLRQILLFQSQSFVVQTQLLQTQKQLLTATVMTNTLLVAANRTNEELMLKRAQGLIPG